MEEITLKPIGVIRSPFKLNVGTPIQPEGGKDIEAVVEVFPEFVPGLEDLDGFSHIILVYYFHLCDVTYLKVKPFLDEEERGVFATRAPVRPNHIGISVVRLDHIEGNHLHIRDVDLLDDTPVLDIKPHIPRLEMPGPTSIGWLEGKDQKIRDERDDGHFPFDPRD